ncbi:MAG: MFS transporter [Pirellula sp.]
MNKKTASMSESSNPAAISLTTAPTDGLLSKRSRLLILAAAFLGWLCAGFHLSITSIAMQPAVINLLDRSGALDQERYESLGKLSSANKLSKERGSSSELSADDQKYLQSSKSLIAQWYAWTQCSFLFGAALGGWCFGVIGDRFGRTKGMGLAILTYSTMSAVTYFADRPMTLCICWFLTCTGVGGIWPNGVALVAEAWASLSRPLAAGIIGMAANIGLFLISMLATQYAVTPANWQWMMIVGASPFVLGLFALICVPESPKWLATRHEKAVEPKGTITSGAIFRPPMLAITLLGIALATVPLLGGWGGANWMVPWSAEAGQAVVPPNPYLKAQVNQSRAFTGILGSLLGGWIASKMGRRQTYLFASLGALFTSQYTFWYLYPTDSSFLWWVSALGFFNGIYFGWLPYCLPEMFPTRVRSAGAGVSFNFGRILTAVTVFATGTLTQLFEGDYAKIGRVTSLIFIVGAIAIWFVPISTKHDLEK